MATQRPTRRAGHLTPRGRAGVPSGPGIGAHAGERRGAPVCPVDQESVPTPLAGMQLITAPTERWKSTPANCAPFAWHEERQGSLLRTSPETRGSSPIIHAYCGGNG